MADLCMSDFLQELIHNFSAVLGSKEAVMAQETRQQRPAHVRHQKISHQPFSLAMNRIIEHNYKGKYYPVQQWLLEDVKILHGNSDLRTSDIKKSAISHFL